MDYKSAGVDVEAGYKAVELMKGHVKSTFRPEVLTDIGGFGGLFSIAKAKDMEEPVLVSGTDGVGTKLKIAFVMDKHDTIGIDAVAMCVNDVVCSGAEPLFFLDYIACGKNEPEKIAEIVSGVAEGCRQSGCSLIGGETAEFIAQTNHDVTILEMKPAILTDMVVTNMIPTMERLHQQQIKIVTNATVSKINENAVSYKNADGDEITIPASTVVSAFGYKAYNPLENVAKENCNEVYVIGSAVKAGNALTAIQDGYQAGLKL